MDENFDQVYQFQISLREIVPKIWRRIQVPETYTFWDLHVAIMDSLGWQDCHLHEFTIKDSATEKVALIGIPDTEDPTSGPEYLPEVDLKISDYFSDENDLAIYNYDFGDDWKHTLQFEKAVLRDSEIKYPRCIDGERACPPEDCGGIFGYKDLLEIMKNPNHERYDEMISWLGDEFKPEQFDFNEVRFDDPVARRKIAYNE